MPQPFSYTESKHCTRSSPVGPRVEACEGPNANHVEHRLQELGWGVFWPSQSARLPTSGSKILHLTGRPGEKVI